MYPCFAIAVTCTMFVKSTNFFKVITIIEADNIIKLASGVAGKIMP